MDGAKIYAQNAIRKKNESLNYLRLGRWVLVPCRQVAGGSDPAWASPVPQQSSRFLHVQLRAAERGLQVLSPRMISKHPLTHAVAGRAAPPPPLAAAWTP